MRRANLVVGGVLIAIVVALALVGLVWTPFDPTAISGPRLAPPGWPHLLGTDGQGSDTLSRIISGAKLALLVGVFSVTAAALIGVPVGILAGM
ncbi:MAG: ABC transporter permease, partial [Arachnia sp.]